MRKKYVGIVFILIACFIFLFNSFLMHNNKATRANENLNLIDASSHIPIKIGINQLNEKIDLLKESGGGYRYLPEESHSIADLYSTYYGRKTFEIINSEPHEMPGEYIFREDFNKMFLPDLYYFYGIYPTKVNSDFKQKTNMLLENLQKNDGLFYLSIDDKNNRTDSGSDYMSTYMAVAISKISGFNDLNINSELLKTAFIDMLESKENGTLEKISTIKNLISIDELMEWSISEKYKEKIQKLATDFSELVLKDQNGFSLVDINNYLYIIDALNLELKIPKKTIVNIINTYANSDGGYILFKGNDSNALPTYLAVDNLKRIESLNENVKINVNNFLEKYELYDKLFAPIEQINADLVSTYYVYLISKETEENYNNNIKLFLEANSQFEEHPYYWKLMKDINPRNISSTNKDKINETFLNHVKNLLDSREIDDLIKTYNYIETINGLNIQISNDVKNNLIGFSKTELNKFLKDDSEVPIVNVSYTLRMLNILSDDSSGLINKVNDKILKIIINDLQTNDKLIYLYHALVAIKETKPNVFAKLLTDTEFKKQVMEVLLECYVEQGLFSYNADKENIDLKSTYYGLWVYGSVF
jgi:prenyltransferase beta subunit